MFPWLFPYGLGGFGNIKIEGNIADATCKQWLLMYHDKQFQLDATFSLIAFNHEQIKNCSKGGYLVAEHSHFETVANCLLNISDDVLANLIN